MMPNFVVGTKYSINMLLSGLIVFICAFLAFSLSAVCGGGAGLLLIPLLKSFLPGAQVPAALSIGTASSSLSRIVIFYPQIQWRIVSRFVPAALPAVWLGAWLLTYVNPLYLELVMGFFLIGNLPMLLRGDKVADNDSKMLALYLPLIGFAAGFVSGLTGAVGLLFNRFYLRYGISKEEIIATRAANELLLHVIKLALYASFGLLSNKAIGMGAFIAMAALLSSVSTKWFLSRLSETLFRRIGYAAMVISGLSLFAGAAERLATQNQAEISLIPISNGIETQVQWRQGQFSMEFEYDQGIEFENKITMRQLPSILQDRVRDLTMDADKVMLEEVYAFDNHYYEVYLFGKDGIRKFDL